MNHLFRERSQRGGGQKPAVMKETNERHGARFQRLDFSARELDVPCVTAIATRMHDTDLSWLEQ